MTVSSVIPPILGEKRLQYVDSVMSQVANEYCSNSAQHATSFYPAAMMVATKNSFCLVSCKDLFKWDLLIEILFFHIFNVN